MSTLVDKDIARRSSSFVENGAESNLSTGSSRDEYDEDAIDFKQNLVSRAAAAQTVVAAAARLSSHVNSIARAKEHHTNATINMGGITIPHHGLTAAFHGYHSHAAAVHSSGSSGGSGGGSGVASSGSSSTHNISSNQHHFHYHNSGNGIVNNVHNTSSSSSNNNTNNNTNDTCKSPFLLPAQLYKSLFANAVLQNPDKMCSHPFPRNLLFSYSEKSPNSSDFEADDKSAATAGTDEVCLIHVSSYPYKL